MKKKLIDLTNDAVARLSKRAIDNGTNFKNYVQGILEAEAQRGDTKRDYEKVFEETAKKHMVEFGLAGFKRTYKRLFHTIILSMEAVAKPIPVVNLSDYDRQVLYDSIHNYSSTLNWDNYNPDDFETPDEQRAYLQAIGEELLKQPLKPTVSKA